MNPGDKVEFLSDKQTEKGPSTGVVLSVFREGTMVKIKHSDTFEDFFMDDLEVKRLTKTPDGHTLWMLE